MKIVLDALPLPGNRQPKVIRAVRGDKINGCDAYAQCAAANVRRE